MDRSLLSSKEAPIIVLIPCESDSSEDEDSNSNKSQESIDSSDLIDSSDDEVEMILEINKEKDKVIIFNKQN